MQCLVYLRDLSIYASVICTCIDPTVVLAEKEVREGRGQSALRGENTQEAMQSILKFYEAAHAYVEQSGYGDALVYFDSALRELER